MKISVPTPFPVGDINIYLVKGDPLTLIDTGPLSREALNVLKESLSQIRIQVKEIEQIILTHCHVDHFGLANYLKKKSGAKVLIHPFDRDDVEEFYESRINKYVTGLSKSGVPKELVVNIADIISDYAESVEVDASLNNNSKLEIGSITLRVIHTPGHTPGSISLFEEKSGLLISGDTLLKGITPNAISVAKEQRGELNTYIKTLNKLKKKRVRLVLPGHGENFSDPKLVIDRFLRLHKIRKTKVLQSITGNPKSAYQIMIDLFGTVTGMNLFLGLSEVFGHLEILISECSVVALENETEILYKKNVGG